jgi:hypothetical protein
MEAKPLVNEVEAMTVRQLRALHCLNTLQMLACRRETINYETLAIYLGLPSKGNALAQAISPVLYDVFNFCKGIGLPDLTVLVVRKSGRDMGLPGPGFWKVWSEDGEIPDLKTRVNITEELTVKCYDAYDTLGK